MKTLLLILSFSIFTSIGLIIAHFFVVKPIEQELLKAKQVTKMEVTCKDIRKACYNVRCK